MKSSKRMLALVGGIAALALLSGCASGGSGDGGKVDELTFWLSTSSAQEKGYQDLATAYEKQTGVAVKIVNLPYDGLQTKLRESAQANSLPDVVRAAGIDPIWSGKTVDLASIVSDKANGIDQDLIAKDKDGKVTSIPSDVTAAGLFVNKSLFDKAGVAYPTDPAKAWTWSEFLGRRRQGEGRHRRQVRPGLRLVAVAPAGLHVHQGHRLHAAGEGRFLPHRREDRRRPAGLRRHERRLGHAEVGVDERPGPERPVQERPGRGVLLRCLAVVGLRVEHHRLRLGQRRHPGRPDPRHRDQLQRQHRRVPRTPTPAAPGEEVHRLHVRPDELREARDHQRVPAGRVRAGHHLPLQVASSQGLLRAVPEGDRGGRPDLELVRQGSVGWAVEGKEIGTDPTTAEVGKLINGQQSAKETLDTITKYYEEHVG
ncbi:extracellular solute-binding protein [Curtobacterium flaccumfaciens]|nr:extracellular solute-binding protein [Curtobacterium flaccumfaciens]